MVPLLFDTYPTHSKITVHRTAFHFLSAAGHALDTTEQDPGVAFVSIGAGNSAAGSRHHSASGSPWGPKGLDFDQLRPLCTVQGYTRQKPHIEHRKTYALKKSKPQIRPPVQLVPGGPSAMLPPLPPQEA